MNKGGIDADVGVGIIDDIDDIDDIDGIGGIDGVTTILKSFE
jgi:hypothetical protein